MGRDDEYYRGERPYRGERALSSRDTLMHRGTDPRGPGSRAAKWGDRAFLVQSSDSLTAGKNLRNRATLIDTPEFEIPIAFALQFRFQTVTSPLPEAGPFVPLATNWFPSPSCLASVTVRRSLGPDGGVSAEIYENSSTRDMPLPRIVLAHKVSVDVECLGGFAELGANSLYAECWCAPIDAVEAESLINPTGGNLTGWLTTQVQGARHPAGVVVVQMLIQDIRRRQFFVHNNSTQDLALGFGFAPSFTAGAEKWTILLPAGAMYESPVGGFTGDLQGVWRGADATGEALVTTGVLP